MGLSSKINSFVEFNLWIGYIFMVRFVHFIIQSFIVNIYVYFLKWNRIGGVMVSVLSSRAVDRGLNQRL
jgi:hypothetical protein